MDVLRAPCIFLHNQMGNNAQLDWDNVRIFLAVARNGRVAGAARRLGVEHTTVSRRLTALEEQVGAPLFHRTLKGYILTTVGEHILETAEAMEHAALSIGAHVRETTGSLSGRVRVGLPPEMASHWLAPRLPKFREMYPDIQLQILVGTRTLDLSRGEADIALRTPRPTETSLVTARVARSSAGLYASRVFIGRKRLRITDAESARGVPLLVFTPQLHILQHAAWFQDVLAAGKIILETNGTHTLVAAARAALGVAVIPRFIAREYPDLVSVSENVADHDVWLVTHPDFRRDPKIRATADFLKAAARTLEVNSPSR